MHQIRRYSKAITSIKNTGLFRQQAYVNGKWVDAANGMKVPVYDPATREEIGTIPEMTRAEVSGAIDAAKDAFPEWANMVPKERGALLRNWFNLINENKEDLAQIMTAECGKPLLESRGEIAYGNSFIEWFAEEAKRQYGDVIPTTAKGKRYVVIKQPVGVSALITPWNFPNAMITRKAAPALAAGCTVVIKPATETPYSALALAELAEKAGIPRGVFNIVTSSHQLTSEVGTELATNPIVRKLSFTGSTRVGKILMSQCASTIKKVSLELGGNAPFIVFDDADIDAAVKGAISSKFRNAGQTCVCANRFLVQSKVYDEFAEKFKKAISALKVGNGSQEGVQVGPLINDNASKKVQGMIQDAKNNGAQVLLGGNRIEKNFWEPTLLGDVTLDMLVSKEEIFGPVAPLYKFETEEEAIRIANNTDVGLAGYFYSRDIGRVWRVAEALEYGMIGVNEGLISNEVAPFGGVKESGLGREGSRYGIDEYSVVKYMCMGGI